MAPMLSLMASAAAPVAPLHVGCYFQSGGKRIVLYNIQTLMRRRHDWVRKDLSTLFDLMAHEKIDPSIVARFALVEARRTHELLETSPVAGKIVLTGKGQVLGRPQ